MTPCLFCGVPQPIESRSCDRCGAPNAALCALPAGVVYAHPVPLLDQPDGSRTVFRLPPLPARMPEVIVSRNGLILSPGDDYRKRVDGSIEFFCAPCVGDHLMTVESRVIGGPS